MKKIVFVLCALGLASGARAQEKQALTFDEALNLTLNNNPSLQASEYGVEAAERERKAAYGLRLPQIGVNGAYVYMSKDISIDLNNLKAPVSGILGSAGSILPPAILQQAQTLLEQNWALPLQDRSVGTVGGTITVPVYTGGKINAANNAAKIKIQEAKAQGYQTRNALVSELTERYYGLSLALQVVEVRRQVLEGMQHHLADAKALEANGIIAKSERLYAEMHVAEAEKEYLAAQKLAETLSSALSNTLNNSTNEFQPITNMFILSQIEDVDHFKQLALQNNPLLRQVELKKDLAVEGVRLQRADFAPQVSEVFSESTYLKMLPMMCDVIDHGTGIRLRYRYGIKAQMGGKTGTTNNNSDGWFMGFTPSLATGVWVGGEERSIHFDKMADGQGANTALPIYALYIKKVYADSTLIYTPVDTFAVDSTIFIPCEGLIDPSVPKENLPEPDVNLEEEAIEGIFD